MGFQFRTDLRILIFVREFVAFGRFRRPRTFGGDVATSLEKPLGHEYVEGPTVEVASRRLSPGQVFSGK